MVNKDEYIIVVSDIFLYMIFLLTFDVLFRLLMFCFCFDSFKTDWRLISSLHPVVAANCLDTTRPCNDFMLRRVINCRRYYYYYYYPPIDVCFILGYLRNERSSVLHFLSTFFPTHFLLFFPHPISSRPLSSLSLFLILLGRLGKCLKAKKLKKLISG